MKNYFRFVIKNSFGKLINTIFRRFNIFFLYRNGSAIGDQICMTGLIKAISKTYNFKIFVFCNYPEIFLNNPRIKKCFHIGGSKLLLSALNLIEGTNCENFNFHKIDKLSLADFMAKNKDKRLHLIEIHSRHFAYSINYENLKNEFFFSKIEENNFSGKFPKKNEYCLIQPNSKQGYTVNKQWSFDNFQYIVDKKPSLKWIQIGLNNEPLLSGVIDLRGETSIRELIYLVRNAKFILSGEGVLNHIASAFNVKSYVIQSGFADKSLSNYKNTITFKSDNLCPESPCWRLKNCLYEDKICLTGVRPEKVLEKIL